MRRAPGAHQARQGPLAHTQRRGCGVVAAQGVLQQLLPIANDVGKATDAFHVATLFLFVGPGAAESPPGHAV